MRVTIHLFAVFRELLGPAVEVELPPGATVADLRHELATRFPPPLPAILKRSAVAVNHDFAADATAVNPGDEVAVIPPVSGG